MLSDEARRAIKQIKEAHRRYDEYVAERFNILEQELILESTARVRAEERLIRLQKALDSDRLSSQ